MKPRKQKTCKSCKSKFTPERDFQNTCDYLCAIKWSKKLTAKKEAKKKTDARVALREFKKNDKPVLLQLAQKLVNQYVRLRDAELPCVSCGTYDAKFDAGHYRPSTVSALRFNTINIRKQCFQCNQILSSNHKQYRENLINLIGEDRVIKLDTASELRRFDVEYLTKLIRVFRKKIRQVQRK